MGIINHFQDETPEYNGLHGNWKDEEPKPDLLNDVLDGGQKEIWNMALDAAIEALKIECDFLYPETPTFSLIKENINNLKK